ncbi:MAG: hypothetical protein GY804_05300 [Alphaproteobacteria bacterium]|nr:hypothetical protein [Alphaproteobacteria bacterium]
MVKIKEDLNILKDDAFALTQAAVSMSHARRREDVNGLMNALEDNLKLWVGIKTAVNNKNVSNLPKDIKANLTRLSDFTVKKTFELKEGVMNDVTLEALINTNLQISEGLLEGMENKKAS